MTLEGFGALKDFTCEESEDGMSSRAALSSRRPRPPRRPSTSTMASTWASVPRSSCKLCRAVRDCHARSHRDGRRAEALLHTSSLLHRSFAAVRTHESRRASRRNCGRARCGVHSAQRHCCEYIRERGAQQVLGAPAGARHDARRLGPSSSSSRPAAEQPRERAPRPAPQDRRAPRDLWGTIKTCLYLYGKYSEAFRLFRRDYTRGGSTRYRVHNQITV